MSDASADKDKSPRKDNGGWVLVAVVGIVLFSGSIIAVLVRKYSGLLLLPPSFKRLPLDEAGAARILREHRFVLMGGPHRGGTTLLWRLLAQHPMVSAFAEHSDTDYGEGAFLQTVLPRFGVGEEGLRQTFPSAQGLSTGLGRYAFAPDAHLTEASRLHTNRSRLRLLSEWGFHWNLSRPVLLEKTPTNMVTSRLLQALLAPAASFVFISRHPLAVSLAHLHFGVRDQVRCTLYCADHTQRIPLPDQGCSPTCPRLQPHVPQAAAPCCSRLQPHVPQAASLRTPERGRAGAALAGQPPRAGGGPARTARGARAALRGPRAISSPLRGRAGFRSAQPPLP